MSKKKNTKIKKDIEGDEQVPDEFPIAEEYNLNDDISQIEQLRKNIESTVSAVQFKKELESARETMPDVVQDIFDIMDDTKQLRIKLIKALNEKSLEKFISKVEHGMRQNIKDDPLEELDDILISEGTKAYEESLSTLEQTKDIFEKNLYADPDKTLLDVAKKSDIEIANRIARILKMSSPKSIDIPRYKEELRLKAGDIYKIKISEPFNRLIRSTPRSMMSDDLKDVIETKDYIESVLSEFIGIFNVLDSKDSILMRGYRGMSSWSHGASSEIRAAQNKLDSINKDIKNKETKNKALDIQYQSKIDLNDAFDKTIMNKKENLALIEKQIRQKEKGSNLDDPQSESAGDKGMKVEGEEEDGIDEEDAG
jgi:flagellar basal body rod protein FlgC